MHQPLRSPLLWNLVAIAVVVLAASGCGDPPVAPKTVSVPGTLAPASGRDPSAFAVWGTNSSEASPVKADGSFTADASGWHAGLAFATLKGATGGFSLYMSPSLGTSRVVRQGEQYGVATDGAMAMDAKTSILSLLLLHPSIAHPALDVTTAQVRWMLDKLRAGWPALTQAATAWDAAVLTDADLFADPAFTTTFTKCVADLADLPATTPRLPTDAEVASVTQAVGTPVQYRMASDGVVVSSLVQTAADDQGVTLQLKTRKGTGLDYRYLVRRINPSATAAGEASSVLTTPNQRQVTATTDVLRQGFLSASSYWGYADIVGLAMKQLSTLAISATGATAGQPSGTFTLPAQGFYEVRLFSGGMGASDDQTSIFAVHNFHAELDATATYNLCAATVEVLSLIPGVSEMLGDAVGQKTLMAAVQQAVAEVQKLLVREAVPTAGELYDALNAVLDKTVKSFVAESVKQAGTGAGGNALRRGFDWLVGGGQRVIKFVGAVPGRVAKGGAAMNRLYSLISPESIAEYHVVAVAPYTAPVTCVPDPVATTCATGDCNDVTNNCGLIVDCGPCQYGVCSGKQYHEPTFSCSVKADCFKTQACVAGKCESWGRSCK